LESLISLVSAAMFECLTEPKAISELFPGKVKHLYLIQ